ncbi:putative transmembrane protein 97-like [Capsicum annuum]|nr:putative transmembrane protein 97-like [Capsicum annuum]KAF3680825.1 putative transmembrane protein 97-like [Capsicum annuum]
MGAFVKLLDLLLFVYFIFTANSIPLLNSQVVLPKYMFPSMLVDLMNWYIQEFGDYLASEKPHFFVGLVWLELLFSWPLCVLSLYAIAAGKSWINTTCLVYGASTITSMKIGFIGKLEFTEYKSLPLRWKIATFGPFMVAIISELNGSKRASVKLLLAYYPFLGFAVLAILRGLLPHSGKTISIGKRSDIGRKKRA